MRRSHGSIAMLMAWMIGLGSPAWGKGAGTDSGLTLLKDSGARSSALGGAFVAMTDDVAAMEFNPASLSTLESNHLMLQHEQGYFDDALSKALFGMRLNEFGAIGLSVGHFSSGEETLYDGTNPERSLVAQRDTLVTFGYGHRFRIIDVGAAVKFLRSELAETHSGNASLLEAGFQMPILPSLRLGGAFPLAPSKIRYGQTDESLPEVYRIGLGWTGSLPLATGELPVRFHLDVPYDAGEGSASIALGGEARMGALALRAGTSNRSSVQRLTAGAGFQFGSMSLDYAFGFASKDEFDSVHKANFSYRFTSSTLANRPKRSGGENSSFPNVSVGNPLID